MLTLFFCTGLPLPNPHMKPPGRCPISASQFSKVVASHRSGKSHCGNFRSSAPQPPRSVNGQPCPQSLKNDQCRGNMIRVSGFCSGKDVERPCGFVSTKPARGPFSCRTLFTNLLRPFYANQSSELNFPIFLGENGPNSEEKGIYTNTS